MRMERFSKKECKVESKQFNHKDEDIICRSLNRISV